MGLDNYDVYGMVKSSVVKVQILHLSMAVFCKIRFYRRKKTGEMKEEVGRGWSWASPKTAGMCCLAVSKTCLHTSHLCPHQCGKHAGDVLELFLAYDFWCLLMEMKNWA